MCFEISIIICIIQVANSKFRLVGNGPTHKSAPVYPANMHIQTHLEMI